jgi:hypothetical protein
MWWYFVKVFEDSKIYRYAYGFESKETTGEFDYNKATGEITNVKYAKNLDNSKFSMNNLAFSAYKVIEKYGAPEKRMIAYG